MARLGDICKFQSGGTPAKSNPLYFGGNIPWITTVALNGDFIDENHAVDWITDQALIESSAKMVPANSIMVGARVGVGKTAINKVPMSTSQDIISLLEIDESKWDKAFVSKWLSAQNRYLQSQARGATIKGIKIETIANLEIPELSVERQRFISAYLDNVSALVSLRKQQLAKLDELVKARFVEMFGDPIANSKDLPVKKLSDVVMLQRGYDLPMQNRNSNGSIPVYGSNGTLGYHNEAKASDGVITGRSGTIGKVYYCRGPYWPLNTTLFSIETYGNDIIYLSHLLRYYDLERFHDGTGVPTLNRNIIHKEKIIDVPIHRQTIFSSFVQETEQLTRTVQQSLAQLETLKKSLMQDYFG